MPAAIPMPVFYALFLSALCGRWLALAQIAVNSGTDLGEAIALRNVAARACRDIGVDYPVVELAAAVDALTHDLQRLHGVPDDVLVLASDAALAHRVSLGMVL